MSHTITEVATDANSLFTALAADMAVDLDLPALTFDTDFPLPDSVGNPAYTEVAPIDVAALTSGTVEGTGVFDVMMRSLSAHLDDQAKKNRITGAEYAKVYLGGVHAVMQYGVQFLLGKDRSYWENLQLQASVRLAQAQEVRAHADIQIARATIQQMAFAAAESKLKAGTARNQYALTKMELVSGYNDVLKREADVKLAAEQINEARAQTQDTLADGTPIMGLLGKQKSLLDSQVLTQQEQLDTARAQTKDTLLDGSPISGIVAIEKAFKEAQQVHMENQGTLIKEQVEAAHAQYADTQTDGISPILGLLAVEKQLKENQARQVEEQYEAARAQTKDTLSDGTPIKGLVAIEKLLKTAQTDLVHEQHDTQRAQTKETLLNGTPVEGIAKNEKLLKLAQSKLVGEQYESQRGQTRGSLEDGTPITGLLGAQTRLYEQQIVSYKRDAETKALKMVVDTWTARKTIDEGVAVPVQVDTAAIDGMMSKLRANLELM